MWGKQDSAKPRETPRKETCTLNRILCTVSRCQCEKCFMVKKGTQLPHSHVVYVLETFQTFKKKCLQRRGATIFRTGGDRSGVVDLGITCIQVVLERALSGSYRSGIERPWLGDQPQALLTFNYRGSHRAGKRTVLLHTGGAPFKTSHLVTDGD